MIVSRGTDLPPPRPGMRYVRVKGLGIVLADDDCRSRVDRFFHTPMIIMALLTLPLLIIDFMYIKEANADPNRTLTDNWMWWLTISGLTLIWIAFAVEFVVKIAVAERRWEYLSRNWLDLVIICIPLLRPLRVASMYRTTKVFRLRGVGFKLARYVFTIVIGMNATDRFLHRFGVKRAKTRREPEEMTRYELADEVKRLRRLSDQWEDWYVQQREYLALKNTVDPSGPPPCDTTASDPQTVTQSGI